MINQPFLSSIFKGSLSLFKPLCLVALFSQCYACRSDTTDTATVAQRAPSPSDYSGVKTDLKDSTAFFTLLRQSFEKKDTRLLASLMADSVHAGYLNEAQNCSHYASGCPKAELLRAAFNGPDAEGWAKFAVVWRMGFGKHTTSEDGAEFYLGPSYPGIGNYMQDERAYVFADEVQVREAPDKKAKAIASRSHCWVKVDTEALCYDDVPEDWLPIILKNKQHGYIFIHLTSWSNTNGFIIVKRDKNGYFRVVEMNYFDNPPGTWDIPGCC